MEGSRPIYVVDVSTDGINRWLLDWRPRIGCKSNLVKMEIFQLGNFWIKKDTRLEGMASVKRPTLIVWQIAVEKKKFYRVLMLQMFRTRYTPRLLNFLCNRYYLLAILRVNSREAIKKIVYTLYSTSKITLKCRMDHALALLCFS